MYESMVSHNERLSESPFDTTIHHMTAYPSDPKEIEKVLELRKLLESSNCQSYQQNLKWCNELQLVRFLIARKYDVKQAYDLLMSALKWRCERRPDEVEQCVGWSERFSKESETGKIYNPGKDQYGRSVVVFDNTVQNTTSHDDQMTFLAWSLEFALREMPSYTDKYLVFIHLENFSLFNNPSVASTRETIKMLCECFPERLGHVVCYRPPWVFKPVYEALKRFIDPRTTSKAIFLYGDDTDGSPNDLLMRKVIGPDWKILTGAGQPTVNPKSSPGYNHAVHWPKLVERVELIRAKESKAECDSASVEETAPSLCSGGTDADQDLEPKIPVNE